MTVTGAAVAALRGAVATREKAAARFEGQAAGIAVSLEPGGKGRIKVDGTPLDTDRSITATAPVAIEISGIGRIVVTPGGEDDLRFAAGELRKLDEAVQRDLAALGVASLAAAEAALVERQALDQKRAELGFRMGQIAPRGVEALAGEVAALMRATAAGDAIVAGESVAALEPRVSALRAALEVADSAARQAAAQVSAATLDGASLEARVAAAATRIEELTAALGADAERAAQAARLNDEFAASKARHDEAARAVSLWKDQAPDAVRLSQLQSDAQQTASAIERVAQRRIVLEREIHGHESVFDAQGNTDIEAELTDAQEALTVASAHLRQIELDLAALRLLEQRLGEALVADEGRMSGPVMTRIAHYLTPVFANVRLDLDPAFVPIGLSRDGRTEPLARLSDGAREQIAIIARLAMGRLMADLGAPAPLILDDALVYADDQRIEAMFGVLKAAAVHHQVIVLTCRERTFERLDGPRAVLRPWSPDIPVC